MTTLMTAAEYRKKHIAPTQRKKRRRQTDREHLEQVLLFRWANNQITLLDYPECAWLYAVPNGGHRHIAVAKKLKAEGVKAGVWDVHLDSPRNGYSGLRIEMKAGKNRLSPKQSEWRDYWESENYCLVVCYSHLEAISAIKKYLTR